MQSELDWLDQEEAAERNYAYYMRMDPETREFLGPIEKKFDPVFGREVKQRRAKMGMVRGAKPENMKDYTVYLEPFPHARTEHARPLQGWYQDKHNDKSGSRVRPCETDAVLTQPYTGTCPVQCPFCYVNASMRGFRATGITMVPMGYGQFVRDALAKMNISQAGYFTSFHEPFNALEPIYHNTQQGAQAFVDAGLPIFFLSRMSYPDWAIDLLRKNKYSYAQKSINTPYEDDWRKLSPRGLPLEAHFEEIRKLRDAGIYVSIQCNPVIAGIVTHDDIELLFEKLAGVGANHVIVKFVEANHPWVPGLVARFTEKFGDNRAAAFRELFIEKQAGAQTTITEEYRREGHRRYQKKATELGLTYALCYEYTKTPQGWKSMGSEFLTADQCHGHAVPFHVKQADGKFHPLSVCPPSGCLRCGDDTSDGKGKCGSELLGAAKALKAADFKRPFDGDQTLVGG